MNTINTPVVTVVIPTLNRLRFISETLRSVVKQSYKNLEIIVSDNGSKVDVKSHVQNLFEGDNRISFRRNDITVSAPQHYNQCIKIANGKYFIIISDDDFISENFIEELVRKFEENPKLALGLTTNVQIDEDSNEVVKLPPFSWIEKNGTEFLTDWLLKYKMNSVASFISAFTRTELIKKTGGHPNFHDASHSDNAVAINLCLQGDVVYIVKAIFYYRVYKGSFGLSLSHKSLAKASSDFIKYYKSYDFRSTSRSYDAKQINLLQSNIRKMAWQTYLDRLINIYEYKGSKFINAILDYDVRYFEAKILLKRLYRKIVKQTNSN